jgi:hypothetical protein
LSIRLFKLTASEFIGSIIAVIKSVAVFVAVDTHTADAFEVRGLTAYNKGRAPPQRVEQLTSQYVNVIHTVITVNILKVMSAKECGMQQSKVTIMQWVKYFVVNDMMKLRNKQTNEIKQDVLIEILVL